MYLAKQIYHWQEVLITGLLYDNDLASEKPKTVIK